MRGITCVVLAMACCVIVPTALAGDSEFAGDWEVKQEFRGQERVSRVSITESADGLSGSWISQRGTTELSDVKSEDGTLTFVRKMERQGQAFEISCEASIVDGNLVGKMVTPRGERDFKGVAVTSEPTFIGSWDLIMDFQGREIASTLDITENDGKLGGMWSSERGESELEDVKIADGELTFIRNMERQGQEFTLDATAKIEGGKLVGEIVSPMGELPFTGTMAKKTEGDSAGGTEAERAAEMVKQLDANNDGKVTEDEAPEQMKQFFSMLDVNADGHVDATEMVRVIQFMDQS